MRKAKTDRDAAQMSQMYALLAALSDDLSLPLLQIKSSVETLEQVSFARRASRVQAEQISLSADNGLQLIEAYRLVLKNGSIAAEEFEPVAIGAVLQEVAHQLTPYAKKYDTELLVDVQHRLTPVLANQPSLSAALQVLSASLIRAQAAQAQQKHYQQPLRAAAHGGLHGLATAVPISKQLQFV